MAEEIKPPGKKSVPVKAAAAEPIEQPIVIEQGITDSELLDKIISTPSDKLLPFETIELPSRGQYYNWPSGLIKVRPIGLLAEQALLNQRTAETGENIDNMIRECCEFPPGFDSSDLLVGDTTFILYYIRGISYGKEYNFIMECPHCGESSDYSYDLTKLSTLVRYADPRIKEPYEVELPDMSEKIGRPIRVGLRFTRRSDMISLLARRKVLKKTVTNAMRPGSLNRKQIASDNTNLLLTSVETNIQTVLGVEDPVRVREFCEKLTSADRQFIREWLKEHSPGLDPTVEMQCPACEQIISVALPVTESFFRKKKLA